MKLGTQADLARALECKPAYISQRIKAKDYRIIKKSGKIDIEKSVQAFHDSGYGSRLKTDRKPDELVGPKLPDIDPQKPANDEEIDQDKIPELSESNKVIAFQKGRKTKAEADKLNQESVLLSEVQEKVFVFFRQLRDGIQTLPDRLAVKIRAAESDHEATRIFKDGTHKVLESSLADYNLNDPELKKKLLQILT